MTINNLKVLKTKDERREIIYQCCNCERVQYTSGEYKVLSDEEDE